MSDILDKAKEHFKSIDRKIIEVPEWEQTIYSRPLTLAEKRKLTRTTKPDDVTLFADVLILKAEDKVEPEKNALGINKPEKKTGTIRRRCY